MQANDKLLNILEKKTINYGKARYYSAFWEFQEIRNVHNTGFCLISGRSMDISNIYSALMEGENNYYFNDLENPDKSYSSEVGLGGSFILNTQTNFQVKKILMLIEIENGS